MQSKILAPVIWITGGLLAVSTSVCAQSGAAYPSKSIRIVVPFGAGGAADVVIRIVTNKLPELLSQQVIIDNRTGAGGLIGAEFVANAAPDGYTLLGTGSPHVIAPNLYKKVKYDAIKDFAPIMQFGSQPYGLTVHPSLGVHSVKELIALANKKPGEVNYASSGNGGAQHLFQAMFVSMAKLKMVHVPYKSSSQVRADLLGGQIGVGCLGISSIIHSHKAGQLRIIAVTSAKRSRELPNIPTIGETVPGYEAQLWVGFLAPRGTPAAAISRIHRDVTTVLQQADVKTAFDRVGTDIEITDPATFGKFVEADYVKWGKVIRDVGAQVN